MPTIVKTLKCKNSFCFFQKTFYKNIIFEFPGVLYGKNHSIPSLETGVKPIKLVIPELNYEGVDCVFVSSSDSLGIFFLPKKVIVYVTEPVLDQLFYKLEFYKQLSCFYEEEECEGKVVSLKKYRIPNIIKIRINQSFIFNDFTVKAVSAGTNLGWVNYLVTNKYQIYYVKSICFEKRFAMPAPSILPDYLFLSRNTDCDTFVNADCICSSENQPSFGKILSPKKLELSEKVKKLKFGKQSFLDFLLTKMEEKNVVLCEIHSYFLELIFFVFATLKVVPIYILNQNFNNLKNKLNFYGEFLNESLQNRMYKGIDPLPIDTYEELFIINSSSEINHSKYVLFSSKNLLFSDCNLISINSFEGDTCFFIPFESNLEEISDNFNCNMFIPQSFNTSCLLHCDKQTNTFFTNKLIINTKIPKEYVILKENESVFINTEIKEKNLILMNTQFIRKNDNLILQGNFLQSDKFTENKINNFIFASELKIFDLFQNEEYFFYNDWYYFPKRKIKVFLNEKIKIEKF